MKGTNLGEFEEYILLTILAQPEEAYSVGIAKEIEKVTGRKVVHSVVHASLTRLVKKGMLQDAMGEATSQRGGKRKRMYSLSRAGIVALEKARDQRNALWDRISLSQIKSAYGD